MNALAKHVAQDLDVRCRSLVFGIDRERGRWRIGLDDGSHEVVDALVTTCPLPQSYSLLFTSDVHLPEVLQRTDYERTLALLVVLDRPGRVPPPGGVQRPVSGEGPGDAAFNFIGDNMAKGISDVPALTFHATAGWSAAHWDDDPGEAHAALLEHARPWLGDAEIVAAHHKRWRFATPASIWPEPCWQPDDVASLAVAGDAFAGPKVEGAALSGIAAAHALLA
jgi:predicted NAD/FAD-dependent oxidoreductase